MRYHRYDETRLNCLLYLHNFSFNTKKKKTVRPYSLTCLTHSLIEMLDIYRNPNPMKQKLNIKPAELNRFFLLVFKMVAGFIECS